MEKITPDLTPDGAFRRNANNIIGELLQKEIVLNSWFINHDVFDPDFDEKFRELNNIRWKMKQLNERKYRVPIRSEETYSLPKKIIIK